MLLREAEAKGGSMKDLMTGAKRLPRFIEAALFIIWCLSLLGIAAYGLDHPVDPSLTARLTYSGFVLFAAFGLLVRWTRNRHKLNLLQTQLKVEQNGRERVRDWMTARIANIDNARMAERWETVHAFLDGKAIDAMTILWNQLVETERQHRLVERQLVTLVGHVSVPVALQQDAVGAFEHRLACYTSQVDAWMAHYTRARHMTDVSPDERNRQVRFTHADAETFEKVINLLDQERMWASMASTLLGIRRHPELWDDEKVRDRFDKQLREASDHVTADIVREQAARIRELETGGAAMPLGIILFLSKMRPEGDFSGMDEAKLRAALHAVVDQIAERRSEAAEVLVRNMEELKVSLDSIFNRLEATDEERELARTVLSGTVRTMLQENKLLGRKGGTDHPYAQELITFFLTQRGAEKKSA